MPSPPTKSKLYITDLQYSMARQQDHLNYSKKMNLKSWKTITILTISVLLLGGLAVFLIHQSQRDSLETMITFTDPKARFSVLFPSTPKETTNSNAEDYTAKSWSTTFTVRVITTNSSISKNDIDVQIQGVMKAVGGNTKLIYSDPHTEASGLPYLDYKVTNDTQTGQGRMFFVQNTIYLLLEISPTKNHDDQRFNNFRSSFTLN